MFSLLVKLVPIDFGAGIALDRTVEKWSMDPAVRDAQVSLPPLEIAKTA
jgi:hypothetical protein